MLKYRCVIYLEYRHYNIILYLSEIQIMKQAEAELGQAQIWFDYELLIV